MEPLPFPQPIQNPKVTKHPKGIDQSHFKSKGPEKSKEAHPLQSVCHNTTTIRKTFSKKQWVRNQVENNKKAIFCWLIGTPSLLETMEK